MKGIRKKLMLTHALVITATIAIFEIMFFAGIVHYYHGSIVQALSNRALASSEFYNTYMKYDELEDKAKYMMENFSLEEYMEMQIIDKKGNILESSSGFYSNKYVDTDDFTEAVSSGEIGSWTGRNDGTLERVTSVCAPLYYSDEITGAVRYVTSIEEVDKLIRDLITRMFLIGAAVLALALVFSNILGKSIAAPLKELEGISRKMAEGDFSLRANIKNKDEISKLAQTMNHMADEIVKSNNVKNEFVSSISHEIRTPLTAIKGWSETIMYMHMDENPELEEGLEIISSETDRLINLVEELLDFSSLQSKKMDIKKDIADISKVCNMVVKQFSSKAREKDIFICFEPPEESVFINCDVDRTKQILINLMENAIKFADGNIKVELKSLDEHVCISVEDDGCGIKREHIGRIKDKFYKGDSKAPGSGIGLSISDELAKLHGGKLEIESEEGIGTKVELILPF